jgi:PAS domain S-box-containing protein
MTEQHPGDSYAETPEETTGHRRHGAALTQMTAAWQETSVALRDSERRYRELVDSSLGLICTHDLAGTILSINPAAADSLGYRAEDGIGRNLADFLQPDKRHLFGDYLRRIQEQRHDAGLMKVVARSGAVRVWMYRNVLSRGQGQEPYVLGHAIDITERVQAERTLRESEQALLAARADLEARVRDRTLALEEANARLRVEMSDREEAERLRRRALAEADEANRLKDEFLSTLSHELRTPLNAIFGWARILRSRDLDPSTAHAVEVIERNAQAQVQLIEEVLDISRIITGKMTLSLEHVDVASILRSTIDTVRPAMQNKRIRFDMRIPETVPFVFGDAHRLQQVFWNLLSNALKFTQVEDTITATLRVSSDAIEFEVADTGIGIRNTVLPIIFDRFRQADSSTTRRHAGLGLGLAIVKEIVEMHGGSVRAESAGEGHGATFTIRLPISEPDSHVAPVASTPRAVPITRLKGRSILIVEDHEDARELIANVLEAAGGRVLSAANVPEAMDRAAEGRPDLLVADIGLPGEDGYALLRRIRTLYPGLPAIALSAYARAVDRDRALAAGFGDYAVKPVEPHRLVEIVAAACAAPSSG